MKILRIIARLNVGGPARHVTWLTAALNDADHQTKLIAGTVPPGEEDMSYFADEHCVEPMILKEMSRELSPRDAVSVWRLFRELLLFRPDIVHTHTAKAGTVGRIAAFAYRWFAFGTLIGKPRPVKIVHTFHGHVFHSYYGPLKTNFFLFIEKVLGRVATDRIVVISEQQFSEINKTFSIGKAEQFRIIPLGIDLEPFENNGGGRQEFRDELGISQDEVAIGFIGRLTEIKNIPMLLRSFYQCLSGSAGDGQNLKLVIVGDGHLRQLLEQRVDELGIGERVIFAGNRPNVAKVYAGLDIVALTSQNEGTPLSLIEAMASGKPVVSTAVGGVVDLVAGTACEVTDVAVFERGVLVRSDDEISMSKAIGLMAADVELRSRLGAAGKQFVTERYSKERLVNDIKELYQGLT